MIFRQHPETAVYDDAYFDPTRFDAWARIQEELIPHRLTQIAALFPPGTPIRLLEVGGGRGSLIPHVVKKGWQFSVVEPSSAARAYLEKTFGQNVFAQVSDVPQNAYDVVHLNHVLEHIVDPVSALTAMRERLRPGGWIWIEVPQELMTYRLVRAMRKIMPGRINADTSFDPTHAFLYTKPALHKVLSQAGFVNVSVTWQGWNEAHRYRAFSPGLTSINKALALLSRYSFLDYFMQGGWLNGLGQQVINV
jgi:predicted SAM-dependent methyltransferase